MHITNKCFSKDLACVLKTPGKFRISKSSKSQVSKTVPSPLSQTIHVSDMRWLVL